MVIIERQREAAARFGVYSRAAVLYQLWPSLVQQIQNELFRKSSHESSAFFGNVQASVLCILNP
jgi:hypothetical protein